MARRRLSGVSGVGVAASIALALVPAAASASTVQVKDGVLAYHGGAEPNAVVVDRPTPPSFRVRDPNATITAGMGCSPGANAHVVSCAVSGVTLIRIKTNAGNDRASVGSGLTTPGELLGGEGADTLEGAAGDDLLGGSDGPDTLVGGTGRDTATYSQRTTGVDVSLDGAANDGNTLDSFRDNVQVESVIGGAGDDTLRGNSGKNDLHGEGGADWLDGRGDADQMFGGTGEDTASYANRVDGVTVTLDGLANDGSATDGPERFRDNVDVENLVGGYGADKLTGNGFDNTLDGGLGADTLHGGRGDNDVVTYAARTSGVVATLGLGSDEGDRFTHIEHLIGGSGNDTLDGGDGINRIEGRGGEDELFGSSGNDALLGGDGNDILHGGHHHDSLRGGAGDDILEGGLLADFMLGEAGSDTALYAPNHGSVSVTLDGLANDGNADRDCFREGSDACQDQLDYPAPRDNVITENVTTGDFADMLDLRDGLAGHADCGGGPDTVLRDPSDTTANCESVSP